MPELPEVETIRLGLIKVILDKKITDFESCDSKVVQFKPTEIIGSKIDRIERRAKMLVFGLDNGRSILIHLKMTGQLIWRQEIKNQKSKIKIEEKYYSQVAGGHPSQDWITKLPNAYTRAILHFDDKSVLFFNDLRRFGYMKLYDLNVISTEVEKSSGKNKISPPPMGSRDDISKIPELKKLGPEPLRLPIRQAQGRSGQAFSDNSLQANPEFSVEYLMRRAAKIPNRKIKQFITDQEIISGVGNIYVDEALFYAKISPLRPVKEIKLSEWQRIRDSIIKVLELGLKYGGSSEDTYVDAFGNQGTMNNHTKVYRHTGEPCPDHCGGKIKRITLGGRGTHYCPSCQN